MSDDIAEKGYKPSSSNSKPAGDAGSQGMPVKGGYKPPEAKAPSNPPSGGSSVKPSNSSKPK